MSKTVLTLARATETLMQQAYTILRERFTETSDPYAVLSRIALEEQHHDELLAELEPLFSATELPSRTELAFLEVQVALIGKLIAVCQRVQEGCPPREAIEEMRALELAVFEDVLPRLHLKIGDELDAVSKLRTETALHHELLDQLLELAP